MRRHLHALYGFYGEYAGIRIARKHVGWYLAASGDANGTRQQFNSLTSMSAQLDKITQHFQQEVDEKELAA